MARLPAIVVLLGAAGCFYTGAHSQPPDATAAEELARLDRADLRLPDTSFQGMHSDFYNDPLGRFMDLLSAGATTEAKRLQSQACAAWANGRSASPLSGRFSVQGVELNLDRLCGLPPLPTR